MILVIFFNEKQMKKTYLNLIIFLCFTRVLFSQNTTDSLVLFSDLHYHSAFEKKAINNFVNHGTDTFQLFMAIDENMTPSEVKESYELYNQVFNELDAKKIASKKINKKIKLAYSTVHSKFLKKYNTNEYYPMIFRLGNYNCVSASMIYSLVYDQLNIPYKVMASSDHVYLIANPGENSIVVETTNPTFEKAIFNGDYKRQYVYYLKNSKMISEDEYKNKSIDEIFEEKFNRVREAKFNNLPGFQYYNKGLTKIRNNKIEEGYKLCQKAYFFYPDQQVKALLHTALLLQIERCSFNKVSDIDYLAQFARFENSELKIINGIFNNIIAKKLEYNDNEAFCESLYNRLVSQLPESMRKEISFSFNLQMSYRYQGKNKVEKYVANALKIKGNHHDANIILSNHIQRKFSKINNPLILLDTINAIEKRLPLSEFEPKFKEYRLLAYLSAAEDAYFKKQSKSGAKYLGLFEENYKQSDDHNSIINDLISQVYSSAGNYYFRKGYYTKAKSLYRKGLEYIPGDYQLSRRLKVLR